MDALRWAHEISDAREALGREITYNLKALSLISRQDACIGQRLDALQRWADGSGPRPDEAERRPVYWTLQTSTWDVVNSGQVVAHFPLEQELRFARAYAAFDNERDTVDGERNAWSNIAAIAGDRALDDVDRRDLRHAIGLARAIGMRRRGNTVGVGRRTSGLAVDGPGPVDQGSAQVRTELCHGIESGAGSR